MIPKSWEDRDFYRELRVDKAASFTVIKASYRELVKTLHPDVNQGVNLNEELLRINEAFAVLEDPEKRALYDQYVGGPEQVFTNPPLMVKPPSRLSTKLVSRSLLFILLALLVRNLNYPTIGPAAADTIPQNQTSTQSNAGLVPTSGVTDPNFNQTLVLMAGAQGPPGVAGIAGKDGFVGLNGYQGRDGIDGAPGEIGLPGAAGANGLPGAAGANGLPGAAGANGLPGAAGANGAAGAAGANGAAGVAGANGAAGVAGANGLAGAAGVAGSGVAVVNLEVDDPNCALGGTKFISSTGTISYACNGGAGASLGSGFVNIGSCDASVELTLQSSYVGGDFMMAGVTLSALSSLCDGKTVSIYLNVKASGDGVEKFGTANTYQLGDVILCTRILSLPPGSATNTVVFGSAHCSNQNPAGARSSFTLADMSARDMKDGERAIAIQISG
jgi:hypothetical protein